MEGRVVDLQQVCRSGPEKLHFVWVVQRSEGKGSLTW